MFVNMRCRVHSLYRERRESWFSMTSGREGSGMVPEMWDKPLWKKCVLIWTRGKVAELGPCIPAETVKVCTLIGLHMMAEENALRSDGDSSPELRDVWRYGFSRSPVWSSGSGDWAGSAGTSFLRITSTTSITSVLKPFSQHGRL